MTTSDVPSTNNPRPSGRPRPADTSARWKYGLWAALSGIGAIGVCFVVAILRYPTAQDAAAVTGPVVAAIGTLVGAYFGIQAGSAGREASDAARDEAHEQAVKLAAIADPDAASAVLGLDVKRPGPSGGGAGPVVAGAVQP